MDEAIKTRMTKFRSGHQVRQGRVFTSLMEATEKPVDQTEARKPWIDAQVGGAHIMSPWPHPR
jgi:hypothetical protein